VTPVVAVVVVVTFGVVVVVTIAVVVAVVVVMGCVVVDAVVVDELQEANITDATMRKLTNIQIVPFFTCSSFFILRIIHPKFIF
jgi:type IV secretory pathway VirB3-like protein